MSGTGTDKTLPLTADQHDEENAVELMLEVLSVDTLRYPKGLLVDRGVMIDLLLESKIDPTSRNKVQIDLHLFSLNGFQRMGSHRCSMPLKRVSLKS